MRSLPLPVFLQQIVIVGDGKIHQVVEVVPHLFHIRFERFDLGVQLFDIEPIDPPDRFLGQPDDIFAGDGAPELFAEGLKRCGDGFQHLLPVRVFLLQFLVDLFLKEDLFQRSKMPFVL